MSDLSDVGNDEKEFKVCKEEEATQSSTANDTKQKEEQVPEEVNACYDFGDSSTVLNKSQNENDYSDVFGNDSISEGSKDESYLRDSSRLMSSSMLSETSSMGTADLDDSAMLSSNLPQELILKDGVIVKYSDIVGLQITVYAEGRIRSAGKMHIVTRSKSLSRLEWWSCFRLLVNALCIVLVLSQFVGPITTIASLAFITFIPKTQDWKSICIQEFGSLDKALMYITKTSFCCFLWIVSTWLIPFFVGGWLLRLIFLVSCGVVVWFKLDKALIYWPRLDMDQTWRFPKPQYPIILDYEQQEISEMLQLRESLLKCPLWRKKTRDVSMGSYWVESIASTLLHREIYNSREARRTLHYFLTYFLPVIFTFQVFGLIRPWLISGQVFFVSRLRRDSLVLLGNYIVGIWKPYTPQILVDAISTVLMPLYYTSAFLEMLGRWLTPFDEAIIYARAKLQPFISLTTPIWNLMRPLVSVVAEVIVGMQNALLVIVKLVTAWANRLRNANITLSRMQGNETVKKLYEDPVSTVQDLSSQAVANVIAVASPGSGVRQRKPKKKSSASRDGLTSLSSEFGSGNLKDLTPKKVLDKKVLEKRVPDNKGLEEKELEKKEVEEKQLEKKQVEEKEVA
eukprot:m.71130 g.71130  ORF g.71130 m.71130 type:complete len:625 (+) comp12215_c0_seq2:481-2355(+)